MRARLIYSLKQKRFARQRGFSLLELVITTTLLSLIATIVATLMMTSYDAYRDSKEANVLTTQARIAMARFVRDFRSTTRIYYLRSNMVLFTTPNNSYVLYWQTGTQLVRYQLGVGGGSYPLSDHLVSGGGVSFSYLQRDGKTTATTANNVYYVTMQLNLQYTGYDGHVHTETVRTTAHARNL